MNTALTIMLTKIITIPDTSFAAYTFIPTATDPAITPISQSRMIAEVIQ